MLLRLKQRHPYRPPPLHKRTHHLGLNILQRTPKQKRRIQRQHLLQMCALRTRTEEECTGRDFFEGMRGLKDGDIEAREEGCVESVEDGVLSVGFYCWSY